MARIDLDRDIERKVANLPGVRAEIERRTRAVESEAKRRVHAPGRTAPLRDSITGEVRQTPDGPLGTVGSDLDYALEEELRVGGDGTPGAHSYLRSSLDAARR